MDYYYTDLQNQARGPVPLAELQALADAGIVHNQTLVAAVGSQEWVPITTVLTNVQAPGQLFAGRRPMQPLAVWSICLGFLGLFCCRFVVSTAAVICGHLALSAIKRSPHLDGRGLAITGLVCGYLGLAIAIVMMMYGLSELSFSVK